jgi:hypothetical protein
LLIRQRLGAPGAAAHSRGSSCVDDA